MHAVVLFVVPLLTSYTYDTRHVSSTGHCLLLCSACWLCYMSPLPFLPSPAPCFTPYMPNMACSVQLCHLHCRKGCGFLWTGWRSSLPAVLQTRCCVAYMPRLAVFCGRKCHMGALRSHVQLWHAGGGYPGATGGCWDAWNVCCVFVVKRGSMMDLECSSSCATQPVAAVTLQACFCMYSSFQTRGPRLVWDEWCTLSIFVRGLLNHAAWTYLHRHAAASVQSLA